MTSTSSPRLGALRTALLASTLVVAVQAWSPSLIGDGLSPSDDPESPYFHGQLASPSWQGRPFAIR